MTNFSSPTEAKLCRVNVMGEWVRSNETLTCQAIIAQEIFKVVTQDVLWQCPHGKLQEKRDYNQNKTSKTPLSSTQWDKKIWSLKKNSSTKEDTDTDTKAIRKRTVVLHTYCQFW